MDLPDDAPKTPKLLFLVGDALLIGTAVLIVTQSGTPLPAASIYAIAGCVTAGALLLVLPFLLDYSRRQDQLLTERQNALEALVRTTTSAVEQASIAANGLHEIVELAQRTLRQAEKLPQQMSERLGELSRQHDESLAAELEALQQEVNTLRASEAEKLETSADKIQRLAADLHRLEATFRQQQAVLEEAAKKVEQTLADATKRSLLALDERGRELTRAAATRPSPPKAPPAQPEPPAPAPISPREPAVAPGSSPLPAPAPAASPALPAVAAPVSSERNDPPTRKPAARRAHAEGPSLFGEDFDAAAEARVQTTSAASAAPATGATAAGEPTPSGDGATRIVVTAYIGIGNKLYVRGDGPGLSWERGVPLQFVSIGKWRWETAEAAAPLRVKLYKNDQTECAALGAVEVPAGHQRELTAAF